MPIGSGLAGAGTWNALLASLNNAAVPVAVATMLPSTYCVPPDPPPPETVTGNGVEGVAARRTLPASFHNANVPVPVATVAPSAYWTPPPPDRGARQFRSHRPTAGQPP